MLVSGHVMNESRDSEQAQKLLNRTSIKLEYVDCTDLTWSRLP